MGSFASAISYRVQHGLSWILVEDYKTNQKKPARSVCTSCGHQLSFFDLIPLWSWAWFLGKCRYCHTKISYSYPFIETCGAFVVFGYYMLGIATPAIIALIILLPFSLSFILLLINRSNPPYYIYLALLLNIFVIVYYVVKI